MIENYIHKFVLRGKWIFVPNERCERKGRRIIDHFSKRVEFPDFFYHYRSGGHIAALHAHLNNKLFFKIDVQNFYYSIARDRVTRAMRSWGFSGSKTLAMWSCVKNPLDVAKPRYVLPIGFVQSPLLASLVLMKSPVVEAIERSIANGVCISVYFDDFIGSHNDEAVLQTAYVDIQEACVKANLIPNPQKLTPPQAAITAFNCDLENGSALLRQERIDRYMASADRTPASDEAFEQYRQRVEAANS